MHYIHFCVFFLGFLFCFCVCDRAKGQHWQAQSNARRHVRRQQSLPGKTYTHVIHSDKQQHILHLQLQKVRWLRLDETLLTSVEKQKAIYCKQDNRNQTIWYYTEEVHCLPLFSYSGTLQTPCSARPWRPGISRSLLGLHLRPCQPALDEVQWCNHHWVIMGGAGARLIWGHDQCQCLLSDVHRWQATPPYYRYVFFSDLIWSD